MTRAWNNENMILLALTVSCHIHHYVPTLVIKSDRVLIASCQKGHGRSTKITLKELGDDHFISKGQSIKISF